jgi:Ca-activated chloride channel family protein
MNSPRINPEDPKWTAYVLGELDAAGCAEIERLLDTSADARALVAELQVATMALRDGLTSQAPLVMTPDQRAAVHAAATPRSPRLLAAFPARWAWGLGAAAAALVAVAVMVPGLLRAGRSVLPSSYDASISAVRSTEVARSEEAAAVMPQAGAVASEQSQGAAGIAAAARSEGVAALMPQAGAVPSEQFDARAFEAVQPSPISAGSVSSLVSGSVGNSVAGDMGYGAGRPSRRFNTETYDRIVDNPFIRASVEPLATFSIDVDTASYSNVRRFLNQNQLPPKDAVRIEELLNYFSYGYAQPSGPSPIAPNLEVAAAPWNPRHRLVRVGIKAREIRGPARPASNLVFLIDVSGSMDSPEKLPLVKSGLRMLVDQLGENDKVSMVVYANATGLVLPSTRGNRKEAILRAIDSLEAGGSTNGGAGIQLAYDQATANFIRGGTNRVLLMTDGDFNVGITNQGDLTRLIEGRARSGVFLSVLGFGMGNLKDSTMEKLGHMGNGHYAYIDTLAEARKVLVEEMDSTLVTVAKDVKIQVDFNPGKVEAYRLIGYENRVLRAEDFNNDLKDAGDMGAGHTVTALFELVPRGGVVPGPSVDPSVFQPRPAAPAVFPVPEPIADALLVLRVRYKLPEASDSARMDVPLTDGGAAFASATSDFRFAASVAAFGMILRDSPYAGSATLGWVADEAAAHRGQDRSGYREEFIALVRQANALKREFTSSR